MLIEKILKANPYLLKVHFIQMYNLFNEQKDLWGLKFNQEEFNRRYPEGIESIDLSESQVMELFSLFEENGGLWYRKYSPPNEFLVLVESDEIDFPKDLSDIPKLYRAVTWGGDENFIAVEFCNEVFIVDLKTGLPLKTDDGEILGFAPIFWERGEVYIDFISFDTFVARCYDRVNGDDNFLYRIENGKAVLLDDFANENSEDEDQTIEEFNNNAEEIDQLMREYQDAKAEDREKFTDGIKNENIMTLSKYAHEHFRSDLLQIRTKSPNVSIQQYDSIRRSYQFFGGPRWQEFEENTEVVDAINLPYFVICLYSMTLADQTIHTHFRHAREEWDVLARYPKFGWCGFGCHHEKPQYLILVAEENGIDFNKISDEELVEFMRDQWNLFPTGLMIKTCEFFKLMLEDPDFQPIQDSNTLSRFREAIELVVNAKCGGSH